MPIKSLAVHNLAASIFKEPRAFSPTLTVSLLAGARLEAGGLGAIESCTPDKLRRAYVLAISRGMKEKTDSDTP